jgi:hypothetical protein
MRGQTHSIQAVVVNSVEKVGAVRNTAGRNFRSDCFVCVLIKRVAAGADIGYEIITSIGIRQISINKIQRAIHHGEVVSVSKPPAG